MKRITLPYRMRSEHETPGLVSFTVTVLVLVALADVALVTYSLGLGAGLFMTAIYALGSLVLMHLGGIGFSRMDYVWLGLGTVTFIVTLIAVQGALHDPGLAAFNAIAGLGFLIAIALGYGIYRAQGQSQVMAWEEVPGVKHGFAAPSQLEASAGVVASEGVSVDMLRRVDILRDMSDDQLREIAALGDVREYRQGEVLGVQGTRGEMVYVILDGHVELLTSSPVGQLTVRIAGPGEALPLASLLSDGTLLTTALAFSDLRAFVIPRSALLALCERRPDVGMKLFHAVAEILGGRYRSTLNRLIERMDKVLQEAPEIWANV